VYATINHRVSVESALSVVRENIKIRLAELAERFSLDVNAFGETTPWSVPGKERREAKGLVTAVSVKFVFSITIRARKMSNVPKQ